MESGGNKPDRQLLPRFEIERQTLGDTPMSKTFILAAAAAAVALGSSFTGTTSAEAGYHGKRFYGHSYGYKHFHYKRAYKPVYVYKPAVVYKPVTIYKPVHVYKPVYGYKTW